MVRHERGSLSLANCRAVAERRTGYGDYVGTRIDFEPSNFPLFCSRNRLGEKASRFYRCTRTTFPPSIFARCVFHDRVTRVASRPPSLLGKFIATDTLRVRSILRASSLLFFLAIAYEPKFYAFDLSSGLTCASPVTNSTHIPSQHVVARFFWRFGATSLKAGRSSPMAVIVPLPCFFLRYICIYRKPAQQTKFRGS